MSCAEWLRPTHVLSADRGLHGATTCSQPSPQSIVPYVSCVVWPLQLPDRDSFSRTWMSALQHKGGTVRKSEIFCQESHNLGPPVLLCIGSLDSLDQGSSSPQPAEVQRKLELPSLQFRALAFPFGDSCSQSIRPLDCSTLRNGKPAARWGRKTSGLRASLLTHEIAGLPVATDTLRALPSNAPLHA